MKNLPALLLLFTANAISGVAQGISMIAIPWYFAKFEDTATFGYIYAAITAVSLFWGPIGGTFVDKYNRKTIFLWLNFISGAILLSIALLGRNWEMLPTQLVALVFLMTFLNYNIHYPNLYAFVQEITEKKLYGKISSIIEIQGQLASAFAGAGAAILLEGIPDGILHFAGMEFQLPFKTEAWKIYDIFLMDAMTYFASFGIISLIRFQPLIERHKETGTVLGRLKVGLNFLQKNPNVFLFGVASYSVFVVVLVTTFYLAAKYVESHLQMGGDVFAFAEMFYAFGAIFAGAGIQWIFRKTTIPLSIIILTLITGLEFLTLALTTSALVFYAMNFLLGITNAGIRIRRVTYLFEHIPNQVYGRAGSIFFISNILFRIMFLSLFAMPFFHEGNQIIYAFFILSLFLFITVGILGFFYQRFIGAPKDQTEFLESLNNKS